MEHPARESLCRPRLAMSLACVAALFTLGFALSAQPQQASAGGLPLPTVTLPGVTTVTLPTVGTTTLSTPTTTVVTTTTVAVTTPPAPLPTTTTTASAPPTTTPVRTTAQVAGVKRLRSGAISIPVSSVRAPVRLRLVVSFVPSTRDPSIRARVVDTRGFRVRRARVSVIVAPARALAPLKARVSADDGRVVFPVRLRKTARLRTTIALTIRAVDPTAPGLANASSRLRLTIRTRS